MNPVSHSPATAKGANTRGMLLERACGMAAQVGLEGVTIGELASAANMSKSGVFAHFGSREDLVRRTLDWAAEQFTAQVMQPALKVPRGLPRLRAMIEGWIGWIQAHPEGCVFLGAAVEYDGRPGPMREHVIVLLARWRQAVERAVLLAVEEGHLRPETDPMLLTFQLHSLMQGLHHSRLYQPQDAIRLARQAMDELIERYRAPPPAAVPSR